MDRTLNRVAALANAAVYNAEGTATYVDGAPHVKHESLRQLYAGLVLRVYEAAERHTAHPRVLDLGAGEGSVTLPFLTLGAKVTAVDISSTQLDALRLKCARYGDNLEVRCEDIEVTLARQDAKYDIIVVNAFLHHIPDYLGLLGEAIAMLAPRGQVFSFQDPLRYDTLGRVSHTLSRAAYFSWRVHKGDVVGGLLRRLRRSRGEFLAHSTHDNAEYHVVRNGVDQEAITGLFHQRGMTCDIIRYFSTQSSFWQPIGAALGATNYFAVVASLPD